MNNDYMSPLHSRYTKANETSSHDKLKPKSPPTDNRKAFHDQRKPSRDKEHLKATQDKEEETPSLFDLSKGKTKKSTLSKNPSHSSQNEKNKENFAPLTNQDESLEAGEEDSFSNSDSDTVLLKEKETKNPSLFKQSLQNSNQSLATSSSKTPSQNSMIFFKESVETLQEPEMEATKNFLELNAHAQQSVDPSKKKPLIETPITNRPEGGEIEEPVMIDESAQEKVSTLNAQKSAKSKENNALSKTSDSVKDVKKDKTKIESRSQTDNSEGKGIAGVAGVNTSVQGVDFQAEKMAETTEINRAATIKEIADQIVDHIQVMRRDNQTETIVSLKHPPILEGSTITLIASDNAKREFNISFANLSPEAKAFLDRKLTEDSLTGTLERKGIVVHMITTTTQAENPLNVEAGQASRDQDRQQQQQQQQQRQKQEQSEEETIE